ncbi:methionine aminopeptidase 1D, mitochondrial [Anabrus simplex]|uniref:methionine aminopeptidase 1D, mitochondrial n=1 Tax=Anabrus simplex TaxID=316456 RepID=UPI0034DD16E7
MFYNFKIIGKVVIYNYIRRYTTFNEYWKIPWKRKNFGRYSIVQPGLIKKEPSFPQHITVPSYYTTTLPDPSPAEPEIKTSEQINKMRRSCILARQILECVKSYVQVGRTTEELNELVWNLCIENNAYPSPLNYRGFPKSVCTSVNNVACHGIPDDRPLQDGDIINVDVTVYLNSHHGDCSETFLVGDVDSEGCRLVKTTQLCLNNAIANCRPGVEFSTIGFVVEETARQNGFTVVPAFTGHGIGSYFHGPPDIYHCYNDYPGKMASGMTFTIEPVLAQGSQEIVILEDGWTAVTLDNGRTAQFEHTVLITESGVEVLTI